MSKQTKTTHSAPSAISHLIPLANRPARKCRTKFEYDRLGQVNAGRKFWPDQTPVAGQQFEYKFDDIGNRTMTKAGGDQNGSNLRTASYAANNLNQYLWRDVPGAEDVLGVAKGTESVTVNGGTVPYRKGEYYWTNLTIANGTVAQWQQISVASGGRSPTNGYLYLPKTQEYFSYDADGNLTNDGRWSYVWDAENRLVRMQPSTNSMPDASKRKVEFWYDGQGRRIQKAVCAWVSGAWSIVLSNRFVYDGWNITAELNATNNNVIRSYLWGTDLSGSAQAAGGVGGLLSVRSADTDVCHFVGYDGNGNVAALASGSDGTISALYEYGPFGEVIRATGPMAKANPIRWSTQYQDDESDLVCYLHRYYNPSTGRWLSRDPIGENGGWNLYGFVSNDPINRIDRLGLAGSTEPGTPHVSNDRHNNYLSFNISCPQGWKVANVWVDYDNAGMFHDMYQWNIHDGQGQFDPHPGTESFYTQVVANGLNAPFLGGVDPNSTGVFGGIKDPGKPNCKGNPVEVQAYMRTRLVAPAGEFALWRGLYQTPDPNTMVGFYQDHTRIYYTCDSCCGRGSRN